MGDVLCCPGSEQVCSMFEGPRTVYFIVSSISLSFTDCLGFVRPTFAARSHLLSESQHSLQLVSLLLLRDFGTLFHWIVELLHPLTHLRSVLRHFSLIRHNRTVARASVLWRDINWLIDWLRCPHSHSLERTQAMLIREFNLIACPLA